MPTLTIPTTDLHRGWLQAHREWAGAHQDGAGLRDGDDVESPGGFATVVTRLRGEADETRPVAAGLVHCSYWWITEDGAVLGAIALRHHLNDFLLAAGGHIGYGVRPSARRRGPAGWALGQVLGHAWGRGMDRVLITCDVDNEASWRTIEGHGGAMEDIRETTVGPKRRYWVTAPSRSGGTAR